MYFPIELNNKLEKAKLSYKPQVVAIATNQNSGLDKVTFGIHWVAQAEQGRLYRAIVTAIYKNYGTLNSEQ
ncbi:MAG: hypothetical protein KME46_09710 [Brasilonema angustatum HA4187-MV1]|jgi:hypothetical protein|nr:hypothetical protein [Brasilonema angustatum HA4187-MV1]